MNFKHMAKGARVAAISQTRSTVAMVASLAVALSGCATSSKDVTATYVSPLQYQALDCAQITAETQRIQARVGEISGSLDQAASNDKALVGVGMVLFWPALFALGGSKQQTAEFARLKGEFDALQRTAIDKRCSGMVMPSSGPAATPTAAAPAVAGPTNAAPAQAIPAVAMPGAAKKR